MLQSKTVAVAMVITITGVLILALYLVSVRPPVPSERELPNEAVIERANRLEETKILLTRYPNVSIEVDRSGRLAVDYRITEPAQANDSNVLPYLRLRILMSSDGEPQELFAECWNNSTNRHIEQEDVISYLRTETCLEQ